MQSPWWNTVCSGCFPSFFTANQVLMQVPGKTATTFSQKCVDNSRILHQQKAISKTPAKLSLLALPPFSHLSFAKDRLLQGCFVHPFQAKTSDVRCVCAILVQLEPLQSKQKPTAVIGYKWFISIAKLRKAAAFHSPLQPDVK